MKKDLIPKIKSLFISGLKAREIAAHLGISESYLADLLTPEVRREIKTAIAAKQTQQFQLDSFYDDIELSALEKLSQKLPFMAETSEILATIKVMNSAKRRNPQLQTAPSEIEDAGFVTLQLPEKVSPITLEFNSKNEAIKVGEQELTSASLDLLEALEHKTDEES